MLCKVLIGQSLRERAVPHASGSGEGQTPMHPCNGLVEAVIRGWGQNQATPVSVSRCKRCGERRPRRLFCPGYTSIMACEKVRLGKSRGTLAPMWDLTYRLGHRYSRLRCASTVSGTICDVVSTSEATSTLDTPSTNYEPQANLNLDVHGYG